MQKIFLEKAINLNHQLKELIALSVDESINYKIENEGIRAIGNLIIKGEYRNVEVETFEETLELDVLATFDKILDQRDFSIKVEDFDYTIKDGDIDVSIEAGVHGVISGEDRYVKEDPVEEIESLIRETQETVGEPAGYPEEPVVDFIPVEESRKEEPNSIEIIEELTSAPIIPKKVESNSAKEDTRPADQEVAAKAEAVALQEKADDIDEQLEETVYASKSRPIFQDMEDSVGTYYLYIVKDTDTYQSIAEHYGSDENAIREYNQNRTLEIGSVLIIPYIP